MGLNGYLKLDEFEYILNWLRAGELNPTHDWQGSKKDARALVLHVYYIHTNFGCEYKTVDH